MGVSHKNSHSVVHVHCKVTLSPFELTQTRPFCQSMLFVVRLTPQEFVNTFVSGNGSLCVLPYQ